MALLIIILILALQQVTPQTIEITPIEAQLLPFQISQSKIIHSYHTFIHYINIQPLIGLLDNTTKYFNILTESLKHPPVTKNQAVLRHILNNLLVHANYLILESQKKLNNINLHSRNKRSLFDIVGKTSKYLFGTLDSDDADKFDNALEILNHNQNSISNDLQLQMSLTKHIIKTYNDSITTLNKNQELIESKINEFQSNVYGRLNDFEAYISAQNTLDQIILNCQNLINLIDNIEDAIAFASLNTLHSSVLSTNDLKNIIQTLGTLYDKNQILQLKNIRSYYKVSNLKVYFCKDKIIFTIQLPILHPEIFQYFHIYPIPQNNLTIIPPNPILILGSKSHQYEETNCEEIENFFICTNKLQPNKDDCIIPIVRNQQSNRCTQISISTSETIIERISNNFALIIPFKHVRIKKNCNNPGYVIIENPSLINIPYKCEISNENFKISNSENFITGEPFIIPEVITSVSAGSVQNYKELHVNKVKLDDIIHLHKELDKINPKPLILYKNNLNWLQWFFFVILIIIILASIIIIKSKFKLQFRNSSEPPNNSSVLFSGLGGEEL